MLTIAVQLKPQRPGLRLPGLEQPVELRFPLGAAGPQRREFHALRCSVPVEARSFLDRLSPFRKGAFDIAWNRGDVEVVLLPVEAPAKALQLVGQFAAIDGAGILLRLVKVAADDGAPAPVTARREVEDEAMGMKLRIGFAAGVVIELRHQQSSRVFPHTPSPSASPPGGRALKMRGRRLDCRLMSLLDHPAILFFRERPEDGEDFGALKVMSQPAE